MRTTKIKSHGFKKFVLRFRPEQTIAAGFLMIILIGAVLLWLPVSSRNGTFTNIGDCLFTATSATCITGLVVVDTALHWSLFGQLVIISLIQIGGVGFMTLAVLGSFLVRRRITLKERLILFEAFNQDHIQGIVSMARNVMFITLICEFVGACLLAIRFVPQFGMAQGIYKAAFISISAFCNAGFDLMGKFSGKYSSLTAYAGDSLVSLTICGLIIVGGLGFFVIRNLYHSRKMSDMSVHTKLAVIVTAALVFLGTAAFLALEYNNPETLGDMSFGKKLTAAVFQSVTTRTAGFNSIEQSDMTAASKLITTMLMFVGGSPGSTAGGVKTVTFAVFLISIISFFSGRRDVNVFYKRVAAGTVMKALVIISLSAVILIISSGIIMISDNLDLSDSIYMCTSALSTVGLASVPTDLFSPVARGVMILLMYLGRVGSVALIFAMSGKHGEGLSPIRYPEARITVG